MKKGCKIAITIVGVALVVVLLRGCVATSYLIPSSGMENSLYQSERILVNKWSYGLRLPFMKLWGYHRWADSPVQKEDILVFNNPANLSEVESFKRDENGKLQRRNLEIDFVVNRHDERLYI